MIMGEAVDGSSYLRMRCRTYKLLFKNPSFHNRREYLAFHMLAKFVIIFNPQKNGLKASYCPKDKSGMLKEGPWRC